MKPSASTSVRDVGVRLGRSVRPSWSTTVRPRHGPWVTVDLDVQLLGRRARSGRITWATATASCTGVPSVAVARHGGSAGRRRAGRRRTRRRGRRVAQRARRARLESIARWVTSRPIIVSVQARARTRAAAASGSAQTLNSADGVTLPEADGAAHQHDPLDPPVPARDGWRAAGPRWSAARPVSASKAARAAAPGHQLDGVQRLGRARRRQQLGAVEPRLAVDLRRPPARGCRRAPGRRPRRPGRRARPATSSTRMAFAVTFSSV